MTWALGPQTGFVEAIDSEGRPFYVGPPPMMGRDDLMVGGHDLGATRQPDRAPGAEGPYMPVHRAWEHPKNSTVASAHHQPEAGTILTDDQAEDIWRQADPVPARAHLEPAIPAWPRAFNRWPFFALLSLIFGAIGAWHLWAVLS